MRLLFTIAFFMLTKIASSQDQKTFINPPELIKPSGYTHLVVTKNAGRTVYISGQIPFNAKGELIGKGDFRAQAVQVFENMKAALSSCGASFNNVIKMTNFIGNYNPEYLKIMREVRSLYLPKENPPANTTVGVILSPDVLLEMEAIAIIKNK